MNGAMQEDIVNAMALTGQFLMGQAVMVKSSEVILVISHHDRTPCTAQKPIFVSACFQTPHARRLPIITFKLHKQDSHDEYKKSSHDEYQKSNVMVSDLHTVKAYVLFKISLSSIFSVML